jgi:hypothetical protein
VISVTSRRLGWLSGEYAKGAIGDEQDHAGRHFNPQEPIARAKALSVELATPITPGFELPPNALAIDHQRHVVDRLEQETTHEAAKPP